MEAIFWPAPVCCLHHWRPLDTLSLDKLLLQAFTQIPWFLAVGAFFKSFLLGGAGPLSILWNREEMNSSSPSLTVRTMTWQDEGVRLWSCTEFCPTIPCLLVIRHISWRPMCVCVRYIPNFKNEGEKSLAQTIIFHLCLPWPFILTWLAPKPANNFYFRSASFGT